MSWLKAISSVSELGNTVASWLLSEEGYREWKTKRDVKKLEKRAYELMAKKKWDEVDTIIHDLKQR